MEQDKRDSSQDLLKALDGILQHTRNMAASLRQELQSPSTSAGQKLDAAQAATNQIDASR